MSCDVCQKPLPEETSFNEGEKPHGCTVCKKSFSLKIQLKRHLLLHETRASRLCNACDNQHGLTSANYNLRVSKTGNFVCDTCNKSFSTKRLLLKHAEHHTLENVLKCGDCGEYFKNVTALKKHSVNHKHKKMAMKRKGTEKFECPDCGEGFSKAREYKAHCLTHTEQNYDSHDDYADSESCESSYSHNFDSLTDTSSIDAEMSDSGKKKPKVQPKMKVVHKFQCTDCGEGFSKSKEYKSHCLTHKNYKCKNCSATFTTDMLLKEHDCEFSDNQKKYLTLNADTPDSSNADSKKHTCDICSKTFTRKSALEGHLTSHYDENEESGLEDDSDGDADYQYDIKEENLSKSKKLCLPKLKIKRSLLCDKCSYVCTSAKSYNKHMLTHEINEICSGERPFVPAKSVESTLGPERATTEIKKGSKEVSLIKIPGENLQLEKSTETDSGLKKMYPCRICETTFSSKEQYKQHKAMHIKMEINELSMERSKTYACHMCSKTFSKKKHLRKHTKTHLENDINESNFLTSDEEKKMKRTKRFTCSYCGKGFAGETCWRKHEAKHASNPGEVVNRARHGKKAKILICEYCNEDFTGKRHNFMKHKLSHTPEVCGICDARFVDRASLREHCRVHIGTEEGRRFLECSQRALDVKNGVQQQPEPKVEYIYLVLR